MVIHSQPFIRAGLCQTLKEQTEIKPLEVLEFETEYDWGAASAHIAANSPDIAMVDIMYPSLNGLELIREVSRKFPGIRVVVLSANPVEEAGEIIEAVKSGAAAYLRTANCSAEALIATVKRLRKGEHPINDYVWGKASVASHLLRQFQDISLKGRAATEVTSPLNSKEMKILTLIANGKSNRQISSYLGTTEQTVKNCVSTILRKLDANDRAHAVNIAVARGLVILQREAPSYLPVSLSTQAGREEKGVSHSRQKPSFSANKN